MRVNKTPAENVLWSLLRDKKLGGYKFRRQHVVFSYIVYFCCYAEKLIVELDGPIHNSIKNKQYDKQKNAYLSANGYRVIRFKNATVFNNQKQILEDILSYLKQGRN